MKDFKFDTKETEEYYLQEFQKYHIGISNWSLARIIMKEELYQKCFF